ncbi:hypothetical protein [Sphingomonas sp. J315]|uniref:hypothetical protein n=1 Tax=Sphingomonas sp. J315 TaxID=2898433 RepID=UPI0021ADE997|nr:hypothetical protein [Sphingomonas sp. J315]UUX99774.1 hypothetical protein LRS08_00980 [Sphingomonas sp. J315]
MVGGQLRTGCLLRLCRLDPCDQRGAPAILDCARHCSEQREQAAEREQQPGAEQAEGEEEQRGERIGQEYVPHPQHDEDVEQAEHQQPQGAAHEQVGDRDRSVRGHRLGRQHHEPRAEQQFEHAALRSLQKGLEADPGGAIGGGPANRAEVPEQRADRRRLKTDVHVEDQQDREPAQHVENLDPRAARDRCYRCIIRHDSPPLPVEARG